MITIRADAQCAPPDDRIVLAVPRPYVDLLSTITEDYFRLTHNRQSRQLHLFFEEALKTESSSSPLETQELTHG